MPELAGLSQGEKSTIISDSAKPVYGNWRVWAALIGCLSFAMVGGSLGGVPGAAIAGGMGGCFFAPFVAHIQAAEIRKSVAARKPQSMGGR